MEKKTRNVITQKEYNDLFKAICNLYGVITSDEIHYLLKHYYEKITKREIEAQVKKVYDKPKRDYFGARIKNTRCNKFYLILDVLEDDEINEIISQRSGKELYIPKTKEELLNYVEDFYMTEKEDEYYSQLLRYLSKRTKVEEPEARAYFTTLHFYANNKIDSRMNNKNNPFQDLNELGFFIKDEKDAQKFLNLYMNCVNNTKMFPNKGWSPNELLKNSPKEELNHIKNILNEGFKGIFENHDIDVEDALENVKNSNLPEEIKESLICELESMQFNQKNKA